jgi:hypothetical protein
MRKSPRKVRAVSARVEVGMQAQFDAALDDAAGTVVFCRGGVVVVERDSGHCVSGPAHQIVKAWGTAAAAADEEEQLREGDPLPLMRFLERLERLSCDLTTLADFDERPRIRIEGRILEVENVAEVKKLLEELQACQKSAWALLRNAMSGHLAEEWTSGSPASALFARRVPRRSGRGKPAGEKSAAK